jgi:hypothetical protein
MVRKVSLEFSFFHAPTNFSYVVAEEQPHITTEIIAAPRITISDFRNFPVFFFIITLLKIF